MAAVRGPAVLLLVALAPRACAQAEWLSWCGSAGSVGNPCSGRPERLVEWNVSGLSDLTDAKPFLVDWNGDGDMDVIVAMKDGSVKYFEQEVGSFVEQVGSASPFGVIEVPESPPLDGLVDPDLVLRNPFVWVADWNGDSQLDVIIGARGLPIMYYQRQDDGRLQSTASALDSVDDVTIMGLFALCAVDWDSDGDVDLIVGDVDDGLHYFERVDEGLLVKRRDGESPFQHIIGKDLVPFAVDWDGDKDLDLIVSTIAGTRYFERSEGGRLVERTVNPFADLPRLPGFPGTSGFIPYAVAADIDGDGDMDLVTAGSLDEYYSFSPHVFRREADDVVGERTEPPMTSLPIGGTFFGASLVPFAVDWDGDGVMEVMGYHPIYDMILFFRRDDFGGVLVPVQEHPLLPHMAEIKPFDAVLPTDWDGDGHIDLLVARKDGEVTRLQFFHRVVSSSGDWLVQRVGTDNPFQNLTIGTAHHSHITLCVVDWNHDGRKDLLVGLFVDVSYFEQMPDGAFEDRTALSEFVDFELPATAWKLYPVAVDWDRDGDADLLLGSASGQLYYFKREFSMSANGTSSSSLVKQDGAFDPFRRVEGDFEGGFCVVDWNADGHSDLIVAGNRRLRYFEARTCPEGHACLRGVCTRGETGFLCTCLRGSTLKDCSRCSDNFYSLSRRTRIVDTEPLSCLPCTGEGNCYGRGTCIDDLTASGSAATASLRIVARGDGSCKCSEFFSGTDDAGRADCSEGACPAGMEVADLQCRTCRAGTGKADPANETCGT